MTPATRAPLRRTCAVVAAVVLAAASAQTAPPDDSLRTDPAVRQGSLHNGLGFYLKPHDDPAGRVLVQLHVRAGSLDETDEQRSAATFIQHLAFRGSENFPDGAAAALFDFLGIAFDIRDSAVTGFDHTLYRLTLPDNDPVAIDKALLFYRDVIGGLTLPPTEVERQRRILLEQQRIRAGFRVRVWEQAMPRLTPGTLISERRPDGTAENIQAVTRDSLVDFYQTWYTPDAATVIIAGDFDPDVAEKILRRRLGGLPARQAPAHAPVRPERFPDAFAIVAADPEAPASEARVQIVRVGPSHGPVRTLDDFRASVVDELAELALDRRMQARVWRDQAVYSDNAVITQDLFGSMAFIALAASAPPTRWDDAIADLALDARAAAEHGFTPAEIDHAAAQLLADVRRGVRRAGAEDLADAAQRITDAVNNHDVYLSTEQRRALVEQLLPTVQPHEAQSAVARVFDFSRAAWLVVVNPAANPPAEARVLQTADSAFAADAPDRRPGHPAAEPPPAPAPGDVAELSLHPPSGVLSAWLENGVRVHHRSMDTPAGEARVVVTLAGGRIEESPAAHAFTEVAEALLERPAADSLSSVDVRDYLTGAGVTLTGDVGDDAVTVQLVGDVDGLDRALHVVHLLLSRPRLESRAFDDWRNARTRRFEEWSAQPRRLLPGAIADALYPPDELRVREPTARRLAEIRPDDARQWLERLFTAAPMEVSIVGDVDRARAIHLASAWFGSLPARPRIGPDTLDDLRSPEHAPPPHKHVLEVDTTAPQAIVFLGASGPAADDLDDVRSLNVAAQILTARLTRRARDQEGLVYSIQAVNEPGLAYPDSGLFGALAPTTPDAADHLERVMRSTIDRLAEEGPSEAELDVAKTQLANTLQQKLARADHWSAELAALDYRGRSLDDTVAEPAALDAVAGHDVLRALRQHWSGCETVRVVVRPRAPAPN